MSFLNTPNRRFLIAVSNLVYVNPFLPDMMTYERDALGSEVTEEPAIWSMSVSDPDRVRVNTWRIMERLTQILKTLRASLASGAAASETDLLLYEDGLLYYFY